MHTNYGFSDKVTHVIGVDEVGWGAIAGPLVVGGCMVPVDDTLDWLSIKDSKKYTTETARETAFINLQRAELNHKISCFTWQVSASEVSMDPAEALLIAQKVVIEVLVSQCKGTPAILVDGNKVPKGFNTLETQAVPKADSIFKVVSAGSVLAKVERDRSMCLYAEHYYSEYNFDRNKGYPTQGHLKIMNDVGPCSIHRTNIKSVQRAQKKHAKI